MKNRYLNTRTINGDQNMVGTILKRTKLGFAAAIFTLLSGTSTAEDVEIYTGVIQSSDGTATTIEGNPDFFPNVLFILDNSTSMGSTEPVLDRVLTVSETDDDEEVVGCDVSISDYNPDIDYSFGTATDDDNIYIYQGNTFSGNIVSSTQNHCQAYRDVISSNANPPILSSQLIQFGVQFVSNTFGNIYGWDNNINNFENNNNSIVECRSDFADHGHNTSNTFSRDRPRNAPLFTNQLSILQNSNPAAHYFSNNFGSAVYFNVAQVDWVSGNFHRFQQLRNGITELPETCPTVTGPVEPTNTGPFDSDDALGTRNNPQEAASIDQICGSGVGVDSEVIATTGRSEITIPDGTNVSGFADGSVQRFKNRYFYIRDDVETNRISVYRCQTRLEIMKDALTDTLESQTSINAGLMRFNTTSEDFVAGGTVINAILPMNVDANRTTLINSVDNLEFGQGTPITEALYEAYLYLSGGDIDSGRTSNANLDTRAHAAFEDDFLNLGTDPRTLYTTDTAAKTTTTSGVYDSPMNTQCQPTNIVLLSDGEPSTGFDDAADLSINNLTGGSCDSSTLAGTCSDDISQYLRDNDIAPSAQVNRGVNTFTIGLNLSSTTLQNIARNGQPASTVDSTNNVTPGYFEASDVTGLETAFRTILGQIQTSEADVFSAPAVTVNAFNRLQSREDIYYALFRPEPGPRWGGNVKRYRVNADGEIVDANDDVAVDELSGFFSNESQSFWSTEPDGPRIEAGGAGSRLSFSRRMFGNVNGTDVSLSVASDVNALPENAFVDPTIDISNPSIDRFLDQTVNLDTNPINIGGIGSALTTQAENELEIAAWVLGFDVESVFRQSNSYVGDSLHGTPYVLSFGTSIDQPDDVVFFTSNQGLLHAIDGETGDELWSYVPDNVLFENIGRYYNDQGFEKIYGLDAEIAFKIFRDPATDQEVDGATLYFGQRRGGSNLYSVDVTNARSTSQRPVSRRWVVNGGSGDFARMGQTWGEPVVTDVSYCDSNNGCGADGVRRSVLFVSGGYDEFYDNQTANIATVSGGDVMGNALYMIDSETGQLLWMAGADVADPDRDLVIPEMIHSIVARPTVIDSDSNGFADTIFLTDIAGQVFRIDFRTAAADQDDISSGDNSAAKVVNIAGTQVAIDNVSGGLIADFGVNGTSRRFYNPIDATILPEERNQNGEQIAATRYVLTTGSGYRAHPLDAEAFGNRIFVLYDDNLLLPLSDEDLDPDSDSDDIDEPVYTYGANGSNPDTVELSDLATLNIVAGTSEGAAPTLSGVPPATGLGYTITLPNSGEKLLSPALISNFRLLTTSYTPSTNNAGNLAENCQAGLGNSTIYSLDLRTGNLISDGLANPGISPSPVIVFVFDEGAESSDSSTAANATDDDVLRPIVVIGTEPKLGENLGLTDVNLGRADKKVWWEDGRAL